MNICAEFLIYPSWPMGWSVNKLKDEKPVKLHQFFHNTAYPDCSVNLVHSYNQPWFSLLILHEDMRNRLLKNACIILKRSSAVGKIRWKKIYTNLSVRFLFSYKIWRFVDVCMIFSLLLPSVLIVLACHKLQLLCMDQICGTEHSKMWKFPSWCACWWSQYKHGIWLRMSSFSWMQMTQSDSVILKIRNITL